MGLWLPQGVTAPEETHKSARQKVCGACVGLAREGIWTGSPEGVREGVQTLRVRLVVFGLASY
jgi:hypothetical protein